MVKQAAYGLLAAFLASGVYGDIPTTAKDWYTPSGGKFKTKGSNGEVWYFDEDGEWTNAEVTVDENGKVTGFEGGVDILDAAFPAYQAMLSALKAETIAKQNTERIQTIGTNLHDLTSKTGIKITNPQTGQSYTIKFGSGTIAEAVGGSGGDIPATSDEEDPADNTSLDWSGNGKLEIKGWATQNASGNFWDTFSTPVAIPVRTANGAVMAYRSWYGVDGTSLVKSPDTHKLELSGWRSAGSNIMTPLAEAITKAETNKGVFDEYELVVRNSSKGLNYVALGTLDVDMKVDGDSVVTNSGEVALRGYAAAEVASDHETPYLPFADGRSHLAWQSVLDFFNTGLFNLTTDGKVNLKGVEAGEGGDLRVMTVSGGDSGAAITSSSVSTLISSPLAMNGSSISVSGWSDASPGSSQTLAELLTEGTGLVNDPARSTALLARTPQNGVSYMPVGLLPKPAPADGKSIVTNEDTAIAICGYDDASDGMIPYKTSDGIGWKALEALVDGVSLTTNSSNGAAYQGVASIYGYKTYAGRQSKHYIGTSPGRSAAFGWWELPNVTTNHVEGDRRTIASYANVPGEQGGDDVKVVGLLDWNYSHSGDPLFVVNNNGTIGYMSAVSLTNLAACACTQKWETVTDWIGSSAKVTDDGDLSLPYDSLDEYVWNLGYIYCTSPDDLYFDNSANDGSIQASFDAPGNWADNVSIDVSGGEYQIKGFSDASACHANLSAMLSEPEGSDATTHLILAKKTDTGELHYVPVGRGVQSGADVDDTTITTNASHGAVSSGSASIYGWANAANDTYLSKNEGGNLEWRKVPGGTPDEASITTNATAGAVTGGAMSILGFASAQDGTTPVKQNNSIVWSKAESAIEAGSGISITSNNNAQVVSHNLVAGAGISITPASSGTAVTIASATPTSGTVVDPHAQELTFITELYYDSSSHQIKAKRITAKVMFVGTVPTAEEFTVVQCTPHSAEHVSDE